MLMFVRVILAIDEYFDNKIWQMDVKTNIARSFSQSNKYKKTMQNSVFQLCTESSSTELEPSF
jgi:hypothetical protein